MPTSKRNGGKPIKNKVGNLRPMVTNFGIRKISNQNFSKVIAIPKTALVNCGSSRTSKLKVELVKLFYKFKVNRNNRLRYSILSYKISDIGKISAITREINLNADRKRLWLGKIKSIDQSYCNQSIPISLNHIKKFEI